MPSSRQVKVTTPSAPRSTPSQISSPASEYFTALSTRLLTAPRDLARRRRGPIAGPGSPTRWRVTPAFSATAAIDAEASGRRSARRSRRVIVGGCCGSLTRDSIARPSSRPPSRSVPRRIACARRWSRSSACSLVGEELGVGGDHGHRVVDLVGEHAQELVPRLLELAQLLEQAPLALGGVGVGDGAAEVVAELEGGHALAVGPAARAGAARGHQHPEHLVVDADGRDDDGLEAGLGERVGEPVGVRGLEHRVAPDVRRAR